MRGKLLWMLVGFFILIANGAASPGVHSTVWPRLLVFAILTIVVSALCGPLLIYGWTGWRSGSEVQDFWQPTPDGYFMEHRRSKWKRGSQKKLCFVARSQGLLAEVLKELASRPDCLYVKYSLYQKDGMYLGRCFLEDDFQVGLVWADFKKHPRLFCSVQDDDFTSQFR
jgi:hypothetical protein